MPGIQLRNGAHSRHLLGLHFGTSVCHCHRHHGGTTFAMFFLAALEFVFVSDVSIFNFSYPQYPFIIRFLQYLTPGLETMDLARGFTHASTYLGTFIKHRNHWIPYHGFAIEHTSWKWANNHLDELWKPQTVRDCIFFLVNSVRRASLGERKCFSWIPWRRNTDPWP